MQRSCCTFKNKQLFSPKYVFRTVTSYAATKEDVELKSWKEIPGPSSLPLIGPLRHFFPGGFLYQHTGLKLRQKLYDTYGEIVRLDALPGLNPTIFIFDPESVSKILREENIFPTRPGLDSLTYYRKKNNKLVGIIDDGENWKKVRSMVNPVLLMPKTIKLYAGTLDNVALDVVERIRKIKDDEKKIQNTFFREMALWSLESIGTIALGCRIGCLTSNLSDDSPASKLIVCSNVFNKLSYELNLKPGIWKYVPTKTYKKAVEVYKEQEILCKYYIDKSIKELKDNPSKEEKGVLEKLMEIDEDLAYVIASDMLIAGVDTTSTTVMAALYLLAVNPEKQNKLREELKSDQRAYLKACIKESLRMMPPVFGNGRITSKECDIQGYKIPAGVCAIFVHEDMSKMEKHFIKSKEYIPERWLVDSTDPLYHKNAHSFVYMPFGYGIRSCIGRRIVEIELETLLARIIENFHLEWNGPPPTLDEKALNYIMGPYNFKIHDLKRSSTML